VTALETARRMPTGFPTRVAPDGTPIEATPRGVAMAWTAGFLLHANAEAAQRFAEDFVARFCERAGPLAACRDWPKGAGKDGPGFASSALGMAATRALPKSDWHPALLRSAAFAGIGEIRQSKDRYAFEKSIDLWARSASEWTAPVVTEPRR